MLQIEIIPLPGTTTDPNSRLYRTCLALLETLHRYGWGAMTNYQKRVIHDCLVPREIYQDLYLIMRERHKHLVDTWKEVTDPLKHVFEVKTFVIMHFMIFDAISGHWDSYLSDASVESYLFIRLR
jgi:tRNASer (uridine44-2'-O)-methyltransferase